MGHQHPSVNATLPRWETYQALPHYVAIHFIITKMGYIVDTISNIFVVLVIAQNTNLKQKTMKGQPRLMNWLIQSSAVVEEW